MEKITLKLAEFYNLEAELAGVSNRQTQEVVSKGLLGEKGLKLIIKYWLTDLLKKVTAEKESIEKLKEELIKKHGTEGEGGAVNIPVYIFKKDADGKDTEVPEKINPEYAKFDAEFGELLQEERELEHFAFTLDHFSNVEPDGNYPTFFKLIKITE